MEDSDGHGTHIVTLLMELAPSASIYVARVAQNQKNLGSAAKSVAEVITSLHSYLWDPDSNSTRQ